MKALKLAAVVVATAAIALTGTVAGANASVTIYRNAPFSLPKGFPALGYECCGISEFGGAVAFARVARESPKVSVWMESYACEQNPCKTRRGHTFEWPITLKIYELGAGNEPGALVAQSKHTFKIPYRPSPSANCPATPEGQGYGRECAFSTTDKISFSLPGVMLPEKAIISVAFNTESYGEEPTGKEGPEDSLNVGINTVYTCTKENAEKVCEEYAAEGKEPYTGTDPVPNSVYLDPANSYALTYLACGVGTEGTFGLTGECWPKEQPAFEVDASGRH